MSWKKAVFRLLGKEPEAIVLSFISGPEPLARQMMAEVLALLPGREHWAVGDVDIEGVRILQPSEIKAALRTKRIGLAPTLFTSDSRFSALRRLAWRTAPLRILAYNERLERHHLHPRSALASILFLSGVPLDRIWLRPWWLMPWKRDRTVHIATHSDWEGRALRPGRQRVAILSPYFPYPLNHGGAVRIFHLLREAAIDFDVFLFAFADTHTRVEDSPVREFCSRLIVFPQPRYREPKWSSLNPPEAEEFWSPYVASTLDHYRTQYNLALRQVEYTQMARYGGDILVEHDITFDLFDQIYQRNRNLSAWWNLYRWKRFEQKALAAMPHVVVMSSKDAELAAVPHATVIENGVDLARFRPEPERPGMRLLFVGSFRHFPNVVAYRWFIEHVWPTIKIALPGIQLTVIAGPDPDLYERDRNRGDPQVELLGFIHDVRPYYTEANLVIVPTRISAGTNLKVIEAMAMERAVVSTPSGCAGLGLRHGESVWIADTAGQFAAGVQRLMIGRNEREAIARKALVLSRQFDWRKLGAKQRRLWSETITFGGQGRIRPGVPADAPAIDAVQQEAVGSAARWDPETYFFYDVLVAEVQGKIAGFLVSRRIGEDETEILNLAVAPAHRRRGLATCLLQFLEAAEIFLEVRPSNHPARALYSKLGFAAVGERPDYYEDPSESALVLRLSRAADRVTF